MGKYISRGDSIAVAPGLVVDAEQFAGQLIPTGMVLWETEGQPRDASWGYVLTSAGRAHVMGGDWVVTYPNGTRHVYSDEALIRTFAPVVEDDPGSEPDQAAEGGVMANQHGLGNSHAIPSDSADFKRKGTSVENEQSTGDYTSEADAFSEVSALRDEIKSMRETIEQAWANSDRYRAVKDQLLLDNSTLRWRINEKDKAIEGLRADLAKALDVNSLTREANRLKYALDAAQVEATVAKSTAEAAIAQRQEKEREAIETAARLSEANAEIARLKTRDYSTLGKLMLPTSEWTVKVEPDWIVLRQKVPTVSEVERAARASEQDSLDRINAVMGRQTILAELTGRHGDFDLVAAPGPSGHVYEFLVPKGWKAHPVLGGVMLTVRNYPDTP